MAEQAAKARIIKHMNADHQASLSYYLQHYAHLSARAADKALLHDISFTAMTIQTSDGGLHHVAIAPPMASWADARPRAVAMDQEARAALGLSEVAVAEYVPPRAPLHLLIIGGLLFFYGSYAALAMGYLRPGSWYWEQVLRLFPGGPESYCWVLRTIFWPVIAIHVAEAVWMEARKLKKHGVVRGTGLWWLWMIGTFIEGFGSHDRFNKLVRRKGREMENVKRQH
jgi:hypothetical protein